ncbi:MAG: hypothetical protein ACW9W9_08375, partial [Candidatus Nitrosopumilus sp. Bin_571-38]
MNNEIGRKITSLTLMTIMLAGGMTVASSGMMPAAFAANANLFVSAENSQFDNYMSGPQVIEVVVIDSDINDTDQAKGEPDVTVNGKILRMVQAVDGNWYGYFADRKQASIADSTAGVTTGAGVVGQGLDFGTLCATGSQTNGVVGVSVADTVGIAIPSTDTGGANGTSAGTALTVECLGATTGDVNGTANNVVREAKTPNTTLTGDTDGQIGINGTAIWPFIQLYALNPTGNVVIQYNKGGGVQSTTLTFDTVDQFAGASLDRAVYPLNSQVHATITDLWLNIDPTDEDSWTFGTVTNGSASTNYQVFDENGNQDGDAVTNGVIDISGSLSDLMCEDNCILLVKPNVQGATNNVLTIQDNDDSSIINGAAEDNDDATTFETTGLNLDGRVPITITEQGPNSGIFGSYDESDKSVILISSNAARGTSASIDYNESPTTILVGFDFATIDIQSIDDEWNSGEEIPVILVDGDANKNSRADEDLDLNNPNVALIPSLSTGDPFTLGEGSATLQAKYLIDAQIDDATNTAGSVGTLKAIGTNNLTASIAVESFSQRGVISITNTTGAISSGALLIDLGTTLKELQGTISDTRSVSTDRLFGANLFNFDIRSIGTFTTVDVYLVNGTDEIISSTDFVPTTLTTILLVDGASSSQTLSSINASAINAALYSSADPSLQKIGLLFNYNTTDFTATAGTDANNPIAADFFSFGFKNDGLVASERIANQIIRIEAEESGDNTSTFEGSLE